MGKITTVGWEMKIICSQPLPPPSPSLLQATPGNPPEEVSLHFALGSVAHLVPTLLVLLARQTEYDDEDDWNVSKAASVCLALAATCCKNEVMPHVMEFVSGSIMSEAWQYRDAAVLAFGSVLDGPTLDDGTILHMVETLLKMMDDPVPQVRDSVAWAIGQICDLNSARWLRRGDGREGGGGHSCLVLTNQFLLRSISHCVEPGLHRRACPDPRQRPRHGAACCRQRLLGLSFGGWTGW